VAEHAATGRLVDRSGNTVAPFEVPEDTVRTLARDERRARLGERSTALQDMPHRDAIEQLRRRLLAVADHELTWLERQQANGKLVNMERVRQIARTIREAASLPGPNDPAPPAPGAKRDGQRNGGATRGGLAAELLSAHRRSNGTTAEPSPVEDLSELDPPDVPDVSDVPDSPELATEDVTALRAQMRQALAERQWHRPADDPE
jgi:hypothetical protein